MPFFRTYTEVNERVHVRVLLAGVVVGRGPFRRTLLLAVCEVCVLMRVGSPGLPHCGAMHAQLVCLRLVVVLHVVAVVCVCVCGWSGLVPGSQYCNNYWAASKKLMDALENNSSFRDFLRVCLACPLCMPARWASVVTVILNPPCCRTGGPGSS